MKKLIAALLLLSPAMAWAKYTMALTVTFGVCCMPWFSTTNTGLVWIGNAVTGHFTIHGFASLDACNAWDPTPDLSNVTFDGVTIPATVVSKVCSWSVL